MVTRGELQHSPLRCINSCSSMKRIIRIFTITGIVIGTCAVCFLLYGYWSCRQAPVWLAEAIEELVGPNTTVFLFTLDPDDSRGFDTNNATVFHGCPILGSVEITNPHAQSLLLGRLGRAVRECEAPPCFCFRPLYGLRVKSASASVDFMPCFESGNLYLWNINSDRGTGMSKQKTAESAFESLAARSHLVVKPKCDH